MFKLADLTTHAAKEKNAQKRFLLRLVTCTGKTVPEMLERMLFTQGDFPKITLASKREIMLKEEKKANYAGAVQIWREQDVRHEKNPKRGLTSRNR